jgi:hypothetical protein
MRAQRSVAIIRDWESTGSLATYSSNDERSTRRASSRRPLSE